MFSSLNFAFKDSIILKENKGFKSESEKLNNLLALEISFESLMQKVERLIKNIDANLQKPFLTHFISSDDSN